MNSVIPELVEFALLPGTEEQHMFMVKQWKHQPIQTLDTGSVSK
jgi:hypothetical protein